jgi:hypothetical protein
MANGLGPRESAIRVDDELAKKIGAANAEEIKAIMRQAALDQGLATAPDFWHPEDLQPTELSTHARNHVKQVTVNGIAYEISGSSEEELVAAELQLY